MNNRDALKWAFAVVGLDIVQTRLAVLKKKAFDQDAEEIATLQRVADRMLEFVRAHRDERSQKEMSSETCERLVEAVDELGDLAHECLRALVLTREPLVDVMSEWYAKDNFGRSDCARLEALMA